MQRRRRRADEEGSGSEAEEDYESDQSYDPEAEEHDDVNDIDEKPQNEAVEQEGNYDEEENQDEEEIDYVETLDEAKPSQDSLRGGKAQRGAGRGSKPPGTRGRGVTTPDQLKRPGSGHDNRPPLRGASRKGAGRGRGRGRGSEGKDESTTPTDQQSTETTQLDANGKPIRKRRERKKYPKDGQILSAEGDQVSTRLQPLSGAVAGRGDTRPQLRGAKVRGAKRMGRGQPFDNQPSSPTGGRGRGRGGMFNNHGQPSNSKRYSVQRQQDGNDYSNGSYRPQEQEYYDMYAQQQQQYGYYEYQQPVYHSPTPLFVPEYNSNNNDASAPSTTVAPSTSTAKLNVNSKAFVPKQFQQATTTQASNEAKIES